MSLRFIIGILGLCLCLTACQTPSTKIIETPVRLLTPVEDLSKPLVLSKDSIIIDARSSYEYASFHFPGSISMQWNDFTEAADEVKGRLQPDLYALTRRLALMGITPESSIVVVGDGVKGNGEEGRIAWMLKYLGVKNVHFAAISYFKGPVTNITPQPPHNASPWQPDIVESLLVKKDELMKVVNGGGVYKSTAFKNAETARSYRIIDVRSPREYLNKEGLGLLKPVPNMGAINIEWKEFFLQTGRANPAMAEQLRNLGVLPTQRIIVIGEDGVKSAAVTMALVALGYGKAGNYAGGLQEIMSGQ